MRRTSVSLYFVVPAYGFGAKSRRGSAMTGTAAQGGLPNFLRRKSFTRFIDETTMSQFKADRKVRYNSPFSLTLRALSNHAATCVAKTRFFVGQRSKHRFTKVRQLVDDLYQNRKRIEWEAPWHSDRSRQQRKQEGARSRTRHIEEVGSGDADHALSGTESFDVAAFDFCGATAPRWPFVQRWVVSTMQWWAEPVFLSSSSFPLPSGSHSSINSSYGRHRFAGDELLRAIGHCCEDSISTEALATRHFPRCLSSVRQVESLKSRTFAALLQGYACSGLRAPPAVEQAVLRGVSEHLVALQRPPQSLLAVLLQTLCIGIVRHQSYADFSRLGLNEIGRACSDAVARDKLPQSVALAMRGLLPPARLVRGSGGGDSINGRGSKMGVSRKGDVDAAIRLAYLACVYCAKPSTGGAGGASSSSSAAHSLRVDVPPCSIDFNGNPLPRDLLDAHPPSRPFLTLSLSWNFSSLLSADPDVPADSADDEDALLVARGIRRVSSAMFLVDMTTSAFLALVDCDVPCGSRGRVLRAMNLVTGACNAWRRLVTRAAGVSTTDKLSCSAMLICVARLAPVLEKLQYVQAEAAQPELKPLLPTGDDDSRNNTAAAGGEAPPRAEQADPGASSGPTAAGAARVVPPPLSPTSFRADRVDIAAATSAQRLTSGEDDQEGRQLQRESDATNAFAAAMRACVSHSLDTLGPIFGVDKRQSLPLLAPASDLNDSPMLTSEELAASQDGDDANVPRHVLAELADALEFVASCAVFRETERTFARSLSQRVSEVVLA